MIINEFTMDLQRPGATPRVYAVQGDKDTRGFRLQLSQGGAAYEPAQDSTVVVRYRRPDGTGGNYDTLADNSRAGWVGGSTVTAYLAPEVLLVPGPVRVSVGLIQGETEINTFVVTVDVQANPGLEAQGGGYLKIAGSVADAGWEPGMYLGTDAAGKVVAMEAPVIFGTTDLIPGVSALPTGVLYVVYE